MSAINKTILPFPMPICLLHKYIINLTIKWYNKYRDEVL